MSRRRRAPWSGRQARRKATAPTSRDLDRGNRVAAGLRTGTVWINDYHGIVLTQPFGGYKLSGVSEQGSAGAERASCVQLNASDASASSGDRSSDLP